MGWHYVFQVVMDGGLEVGDRGEGAAADARWKYGADRTDMAPFLEQNPIRRAVFVNYIIAMDSRFLSGEGSRRPGAAHQCPDCAGGGPAGTGRSSGTSTTARTKAMLSIRNVSA